jgi:phage/plasmid-like protein (TIGR03299 family)
VPANPASMTRLDQDGRSMRWQTVPDRQAITRSDTHAVLGIFTDGYQRHQYDQWLLSTVANILDDDLCISSAGLLRGGAIAWVKVSVPESITTPEGVTFRPNLLATTSFDGSIATTFKRTVTDTVCDNTRELALAEAGQSYKVKHSRHSTLRLADARQALAMIMTR